MTKTLQDFLPLRIIVRKGEGGVYEGLIENSFSMGWNPHRVLIWWSGKATSNFGGSFELDAVKETAQDLHHYKDAEIFDPMSPDCPIVVDVASWFNVFINHGPKFECRNAYFEQGRGHQINQKGTK